MSERRTRAKRGLSPPPSQPPSVSILGILVGLIVGVGVGLYYTWNVSPVVQTNVAPWQIGKAGQTAWMIAVSAAWARDGDLLQAANRLSDLRLNDQTFQRVADTACELSISSYAQSDSGLIAIRSMVNLAAGQGRSGCASSLFRPTPTLAPTATTARPTATLIPPASKTATFTPGPTFTPATLSAGASLTPTANGVFRIVRSEPYCSAKSSGVIEVLVQETDGTGIPGIAVLVDWSGGRDRFFTGLKPERDDGYADFTMRADETYTVTLPGLGDRSNPVTASACTDRTAGGSALTSYRLYFRRVAR